MIAFIRRFIDCQPSFKTLGWVSALFYAFAIIVFQFPLERWAFEVASWILILGLGFCYWKGYGVLLKENAWDSTLQKNHLGEIVKGALLLGILALAVPPFHSHDVFDYINRGWLQAHYHLNPYIHPVDHLLNWPNDPMITDTWVNNPSPYGFFFMELMQGVAWLGMGSLSLTLFGVKGLNLLCWLGCGVLLWKSISFLNREEALTPNAIPQKSMALYLFGWNPLVLLQALANAHNDIVMAFFLMLGAYWMIKKNWLLILPTLVAGVFIKYSLLYALPLVGVWMLKRFGFLKTGGSLLLSGFVFAIIAWPYIGDWESFQVSEIQGNATLSHGSFHCLLLNLYKFFSKIIPGLVQSIPMAEVGLKRLFLLGCLLFAAWQLSQFFRKSQNTQTTKISTSFFSDLLLNQMLLVCLFSLKLYPWYLVIFFPFSLLLPKENKLRGLTLIWTVTNLLGFTFLGTSHILNYGLMILLPVVWVYPKYFGLNLPRILPTDTIASSEMTRPLP
jgi:alpha-1,6-mannosyltransferase